MSKQFIHPIPDSLTTFRSDLFKGKVLFCTGGRSGICYGIVETMMKHGVSACIIGRDAKGCDESAARLSRETGGTCIAAGADVRELGQVEQAVDKCVKEFGKIDFVICGAAGNFLAPISGLSARAFKTVVDIDLLGTYNTVKATLPHLRESHGAYLHISATLHYRGMPFQAHVSAAKAGVDALSAVIAVEEGPRGVRSNVVAPGPIAGTVGMDKLNPKGWKPERDIAAGRMGHPCELSSPSLNLLPPLPSYHTPAPNSSPTYLEGSVRLTRTADIANAAVFLFSPAATFVTGTVLQVDGAESHLRGQTLPYPAGVLDPGSVKALIKPKL